MAGALGHLGELTKARLTRRSAERENGQALGELETKPLELPAGLEAEWLGEEIGSVSADAQIAALPRADLETNA